MTSTRSLSIAVLLAAFVIAGSIWTRPAMGTKTFSIGQGDIGVVDIYHLVDILIMSDDASSERAQFEIDGQAQIVQYESQLTDIQNQMSTMTQNDPGASQLYGQYQQLTQLIQQTTNQINAGYQTLLATQIANAYTTIHTGVNQVAKEQGYTFVLATRRGTDLVQTTTLTGVTQEILARPLITPPEAVDLTDSVRIHLGLPTFESITTKIKAEQEAATQAEAEAQAEAAAEAEAEAEATQESTSDELPTPATEIIED